MPEDNETIPPTKQERIGQWLCMVGMVCLLLSFFATAFNFGWLVLGIALDVSGYQLIRKAEKSRQPNAQATSTPKTPKRKPKPVVTSSAGPEDDPAFMAQLAQRIRRPDSTD